MISISRVARRVRRLRITQAWLWPFLLSVVVVVLVAAAGVAAFETDTVSSYWQGLWWSISLITTVGFIGQPPHTAAGAVLSVILMVLGFILLAMVSASLAALFVRDEERPRDERGDQTNREILEALHDIQGRLADLEAGMAQPADVAPMPLVGAGGNRARVS